LATPGTHVASVTGDDNHSTPSDLTLVLNVLYRIDANSYINLLQ